MKKTYILAFAVLLTLTAATQVYAAGLVPCGGEGEKACDFCFLFAMIKKIVDFLLFSIIPPVAALIIVICGFSLIVNKENAAALNKAKSIMLATLTGLGIVFAGWVVVNTTLMGMKVTAWEGTEGKWWKFSLVCDKAEKSIVAGENDIEVCPDGLTDAP
jgi:hypothetical protein